MQLISVRSISFITLGLLGGCSAPPDGAPTTEPARATLTAAPSDSVDAGALPAQPKPIATVLERKTLVLDKSSDFPIRLTFAADELTDVEGGVELKGDVSLITALGELTLANADLTLGYDSDGETFDTVAGSVDLPSPNLGVLTGFTSDSDTRAVLGYATGAWLKAHGVDAPIEDARKYLAFDYSAGFSASQGNVTISGPSQSGTLVVDPRDPAFYVTSGLAGLVGIGDLPDAALGFSAEGRLVFDPLVTWGIEEPLAKLGITQGDEPRTTFRLGTAPSKCLNLRSTAQNTPIDFADCDGSPRQQWLVRADGSIRSALDDSLCIDVKAKSTANGTAIEIYPCTGAANQRWTQSSDGLLHSGLSAAKCLDDPDLSIASGTPLVLWDCNGGTNQQWLATTQAPSGSGGGHIYVKGKVTLPIKFLPVTLSGEWVYNIDPDGKGRRLGEGGPDGIELGGNVTGGLDYQFYGLDLELTLSKATIAGRLGADQQHFVVSGVQETVDWAKLSPLPFTPKGTSRIAALIDVQDPTSEYFQAAADYTLRTSDLWKLANIAKTLGLQDVTLAGATLRIDKTGVRVTGQANTPVAPFIAASGKIAAEAFLPIQHPEQFLVTMNGDISIGGVSLASASQRLDQSGATASGSLKTALASVNVTGEVTGSDASLKGSLAVRIPCSAQVDETVSQVVSGTLTGYSCVSTSASCGTHVVEEAFKEGIKCISSLKTKQCGCHVKAFGKCVIPKLCTYCNVDEPNTNCHVCSKTNTHVNVNIGEVKSTVNLSVSKSGLAGTQLPGDLCLGSSCKQFTAAAKSIVTGKSQVCVTVPGSVIASQAAGVLNLPAPSLSKTLDQQFCTNY